LFKQPRALVAHRHGVDHDLHAFRSDQRDHLEQVPGGVRADEQPTVGSSPASSIASAWSMSWSATPWLRAES
jgi:hypothetical protein